MKTIIFTGGGSGGHIIPNIALIENLKQQFDEIHYIGSENGIEKDLLSHLPFVKFHSIKCAKFNRSFDLKNLKIPFVLIKSIIQSKKIIQEVKPSIIFSKGGYVAVPVALATPSTIPLIAHESDITMGLANKLIYTKCKVMCFSFKTTALKYKKGKYIPSLIRNQIFKGNKEKIINKYKLNRLKTTLLIMGGSLGATKINNVIFNNINKLCDKFNVIHIVGKNKTNNIKAKDYVQVDYTNNIEDYLACANIIISRSGSNAIFEFLALKKPMILVPLPLEQSRGDQILNAEYFKKNNWADIIYQEDFTYNNLITKINSIEENKENINKILSKLNYQSGCKKMIDLIMSYSK